MAATTYTVKEPLKHDGTRYAPGAVLELEDKAAAALVAQRIIEKGGKLKKAETPPPATE